MSFPFTSKLGTNYCPEDEIAQIRNFLADPTLRLKHVAEGAQLQKALDERVRLRAYIDAHRALISPVRRLPVDVIQKIFIACLPTRRNCVMSAAEAPVLLGRICSSWRTISLSTPHLWSRLHIVEPACPEDNLVLFEEKLAQRRQTTKMWLSRSGQCPLSISLKCTFGPNDFTCVPEDHLVPALVPFASRWEHITFATKLASVLSPLFHLTAADVPILKSVDIRPPTGDIAKGTTRWAELLGFLRGPEIRSVSIFAGTNFTPLELPLRWHRLTDLSITVFGARYLEFMTSERALQVISRCHQLGTCQFFIEGDSDISSRLGEPIIELPFLHTLELNIFRSIPSFGNELFSCLSLPQLRKFKLRTKFGRNHGPEPISGISCAPLHAAAPGLENLDLTIRELFFKSALADYLHGLPPSLGKIAIHASVGHSRILNSAVLDDDVLESLIPSPDFPTTCPSLQTLEINYPCCVSDDALLRLINSRPFLKRVAMYVTRDMQHLRPQLQPWIQSGLDLDLIHLSIPSTTSCHFSPWEDLPDALDFIQAP
ncbi:hypothetical protein FB451DRAFT_1305118 [Mycena latifolia]|nr:hypothetical protein FB451DRAFT_1305118 [Mycena latifolia]